MSVTLLSQSSTPVVPSFPAPVRPPVTIEVRRGDLVESRHRVALAVVDADGAVVECHGDIAAPIYPRSAIKLLQALPLVESGAADAFNLAGAELALAAASHSGEPIHTDTVRAWLGRIGLGPGDLECGAHWPQDLGAQIGLARSGEGPSALHNNCSGKHTGFLTTCRHLGEATAGYIAADHPAQRRAVAVFEAMCALDLSRAPRAIDGCGLPQIGIPLPALAYAMARFGAPQGLAPVRAEACRRILAAIVAHPVMIAGQTRVCTRLNALARGRAVVKGGAEGVYMGTIPERGLGFAVKVEDGAGRAAEVAAALLVSRLATLDEGQRASLQALIAPPVLNVAGKEVGRIAPSPEW